MVGPGGGLLRGSTSYIRCKKGSVLVPVLFLAYINDLLDRVKSHLRLFADDMAAYLANTKLSDSGKLRANRYISKNGKPGGTCSSIPVNAREYI